ncbi:division/cell wall cluster transcriptional repressor MraZ [Prevotella sp. OH937_COT-195]|uniref:division/cell wall cluster transcriptional repressor MraZ n=1 Tax=Prevotella sp. OH937_COT-195 TaxID=2491051 RepID=UPI000F64681B|nr:cell division/cell wall cluster transcriptional repressor MraZ [Prevotella sp. OH937_COT-195]RRD00797.1 cell division/cell wall cluster transcriptional repressor MraZ [Prevotella sp. OH937_COT-195]
MRFLGNIEAKVDAKGRSFLPAAFRKVLQASGEESLVMRMDPHQKCIVLYPESVWNAEMDAMESRLGRWDRTEQQIYRQFVSMVELVTLDGNGRFLVPRRYLQMAGIGQNVRFIGVRNTIEMWDVAELENQFVEPAEFSELFGKMMSEKEKNISE